MFGNTISCEERVANRFRYQGEQYAPVTRQYYLRARYYNPVIGRFTQEDTYYGDGLNLYEYCRNNTITYKDSTGHNICATQRDLYHKYREEGMNPQEAYRKMRKDLGLDSKSGYKDSGVGNGNDPWRSYESGTHVLPNAEDLKMSQTVQNHMNDVIKKGPNAGQLSRPYIDSDGTTLLLKEIMESADSVPDTILQSGLRWDVSGTFRGSTGTWELVVDTSTNTVVHFNFVAQ